MQALLIDIEGWEIQMERLLKQIEAYKPCNEQEEKDRELLIQWIRSGMDIVNVLLFDGKSEVEENELVNTTVHSQYKAEDGKVHEQERDIAKYWKRGGTDIVLYGIENQTKVEKRMPARISGYEGA